MIIRTAYIDYEIDVKRSLDLDPNFKQIKENQYGLLPYDQEEKNFDYDYKKLIQGAYYYDPVKRRFVYYIKSADNKKVTYYGIKYPTLKQEELFTFELDKEGNPIQKIKEE
jgi:hypothetical protein